MKRVVHRRYHDKRDRPDLRELAVCNNINGPLKGALLTSDPEKVTCGRCIRIRDGVRVNPPPFSDAEKRRISRSLAVPPKKRVWNSGTEREEDATTGRATIPGEPRLTWEKQSYKRYAAIVPGANVHIEVVRSGRAGLMNERWHPVVFGNRWAGPTDGFETLTDAMACAEITALAYARSTLEAFR